MHVPRLPLLAGIFIAQAALAGTKPIEFDFIAPDTTLVSNPFSREIWAKVATPSGTTLTLPAYYADNGLYAVRARPNEVGVYRFGAVSETTRGTEKADIVVTLVTPAEVQNTTRTRLPSILRSPKQHRRLIRSDGIPYVPAGANLAWSPDDQPDTVGFYQKAFPAFAKANLNWMRIWMAHWDGLNLDWLPASMGQSPRPGILSEQVAENWDQILGAAEENGVYVQLVLQYHGQYTTANDSNWAQNPWNAANKGGFLKEPADFFTDINARVITLMKYRYIVARWGWNPAIVSWELFNEVHWTDAFRQGHEDDVAKWHSIIANYIRSVDVYNHLITTSTENLESPIYDKLDYYQPHLYAANLIAAARSFEPAYAGLDKPAFYGEVGNDHEAASDEAKKSGVDLVPPVWASIMGEGNMPAQPWDGWNLVAQNRLGELGAVFRFIAVNRFEEQPYLLPFSAVVQCKETAPLKIAAGEHWQHRAALDITYPLDGTVPIEAANVAATLVGTTASIAEGFPYMATYHLDLPRQVTMHIRFNSVAAKGGGLRVGVDGTTVADQKWAAGETDPHPAELEFAVGAGQHTLALENPGPDWIGISEIDLGLDGPALALIGRRSDTFIAAWVWNRNSLYAVNPTSPVTGTVMLDDVAAGSWKVTWWDTLAGAPSESHTLSHPGGMLQLPTPPILRHAAVVLTRLP